MNSNLVIATISRAYENDNIKTKGVNDAINKNVNEQINTWPMIFKCRTLLLV